VNGHRIIALLGRPDQPTDAVEDYCCYLGEALEAHQFELLIERVGWAEAGWTSSLRSLRRRARQWRNCWFLVQYTALAWSRRGFPQRFLRVLRTLKSEGTRIGVVYHDVEPFGGGRLVDRVRRAAQIQVMRAALRKADTSIFTVPMEKLSWINRRMGNACFIPVGANLPTLRTNSRDAGITRDGKLSITVFGITGGAPGRREIQEIAEAIRYAASRFKNLRLIVLGRNSRAAEAEIRTAIGDCGIEVRVLGVLPAEDVVDCISTSDVLLFVRGHISTRRSSAIAGIACGVPVVAFEGAETAPPITEAGLALYSPQREGHLGEVLASVLGDECYRAKLAEKSTLAQRQYFSWAAIAARYAELLRRER